MITLIQAILEEIDKNIEELKQIRATVAWWNILGKIEVSIAIWRHESHQQDTIRRYRVQGGWGWKYDDKSYDESRHRALVSAIATPNCPAATMLDAIASLS